MNDIFVPTPQGGYRILIGAGLLQETGKLISPYVPSGQVVVISNETVAPLYADCVLQSLSAANLTANLLQVADGEEYKRLNTVRALYDGFLQAGLDRKGGVVALGGGVVGDIAGFVAATFLRGIAFLPLPTTLLAMVDASVGGKTGVDLPQGKNLVGAFKFPEIVIMDPDLLQTLPDVEFRSGMAEVIKHALLVGRDLLTLLRATSPLDLATLIACAVQVKVDIVAEDPFEQGKRSWLNLGHTFGHALEQVSGYRLRHGLGVGLGLLSMAHLSVRLGLADLSLVKLVDALLGQYRLPRRWKDELPSLAIPSAEAVYAAMAHDKKRHGSHWRFVLLRRPGEPLIVTDPPAGDVVAAIAAVL